MNAYQERIHKSITREHTYIQCTSVRRLVQANLLAACTERCEKNRRFPQTCSVVPDALSPLGLLEEANASHGQVRQTTGITSTFRGETHTCACMSTQCAPTHLCSHYEAHIRSVLEQTKIFLQEIYMTISKQHQLPLSDFPPAEEVRTKLAEIGDFHK